MDKASKEKQPLPQKEQHIYRSCPEEEGDFCTPQYGNVSIADGWEFLPRGNAFVTRQVKKGPHWVLKGRYNRRNKGTTIAEVALLNFLAVLWPAPG